MNYYNNHSNLKANVPFEELPTWFKEARTKDAVVEMDTGEHLDLNGTSIWLGDGDIIWHSGTWHNGTWLGGSWYSGKWENGIWCDGTWHSGTWGGLSMGKDNIWVKRPGTGKILAEHFNEIIGQTATRDIENDEQLTFDDII